MGSGHLARSQPSAQRMAGKANRWNVTKADTGLPGSPKKYLFPLLAKVIGLLQMQDFS